jgi:CBS domain-containing protein
MTAVDQDNRSAPDLMAKSARELMLPNLVSLWENSSIEEAVALLVRRGFRAAPVIDKAGRPVGVLSTTDLLIHQREKKTNERPATRRVGEVMTPAVFSVRPEDSARRVVEHMTAFNVHQVYVVDRDGILVGVISALDVVRHLATAEVEQ